MEAELECLQNEGIIEPVQFADWEAPIVPIVKADNKSLRICGDFKLTANQASKLDHHPIPKIEDCLQSCQVENGFQTPNSTCHKRINKFRWKRNPRNITHRGLLQFNQLPFGVSSAPGVFQRITEFLLNESRTL